MRRPILMLTLALGLAATGTAWAASPNPAPDKTDRVLVDKLVVLFEQMAQSPIKIDAVLDELMASAKKARAEQRIDGQFFSRYTRLLRVFKLMTLEDKEGILRPVTERECLALIRDVEGGGAPAECSVPALAKAVTRELESLKE